MRDYEELEYIESSGGTCSIVLEDTLFFERPCYTVRFDFSPTRVFNYGDFFTTELGGLYFSGGWGADGKVFYRYSNGSNNPIAWSKSRVALDLRSVVEFKKANTTHSLSVDGSTASFTATTLQKNVNLDLRFGYKKTYSVSVETDDSVVNFIPARRTDDGAVGMYDTVTRSFFANQGSGSFIAGPATGRYY